MGYLLLIGLVVFIAYIEWYGSHSKVDYSESSRHEWQD